MKMGLTHFHSNTLQMITKLKGHLSIKLLLHKDSQTVYLCLGMSKSWTYHAIWVGEGQ